jgi:hypothetical protein
LHAWAQPSVAPHPRSSATHSAAGRRGVDRGRGSLGLGPTRSAYPAGRLRIGRSDCSALGICACQLLRAAWTHRTARYIVTVRPRHPSGVLYYRLGEISCVHWRSVSEFSRLRSLPHRRRQMHTRAAPHCPVLVDSSAIRCRARPQHLVLSSASRRKRQPCVSLRRVWTTAQASHAAGASDRRKA